MVSIVTFSEHRQEGHGRPSISVKASAIRIGAAGDNGCVTFFVFYLAHIYINRPVPSWLTVSVPPPHSLQHSLAKFTGMDELVLRNVSGLVDVGRVKGCAYGSGRMLASCAHTWSRLGRLVACMDLGASIAPADSRSP
jgi:hypothetical protein